MCEGIKPIIYLPPPPPPPHTHTRTHTHSAGADFVGHRFDVPFKELLSDAAFKLYLQQDQVTMASLCLWMVLVVYLVYSFICALCDLVCMLMFMCTHTPTPSPHTHTHTQTDVWESLAIVLTSLVTFDLVSSPLLEGLWLCRQLQLPEEAQQVSGMMQANKSGTVLSFRCF